MTLYIFNDWKGFYKMIRNESNFLILFYVIFFFDRRIKGNICQLTNVVFGLKKRLLKMSYMRIM